MSRYQMPTDGTQWSVQVRSESTLTWEYEDRRAPLTTLYEKGKHLQWDAGRRIDWSVELDPDNPQQLDDCMMPLHGSALWARLPERERAHLRLHQQAHSLSQFLHGEQGAMLMAARVVNLVPDMDAKLYAATQVMDEARHVEVYSRLLHEKFRIVYPITPGLKALVQDVLSETRWDMLYLGNQVLIEGVALAVFQRLRDHAKNPLAVAINAYVMQDEARHVAFGRLALRGVYPHLSQHELAEREEFVVEALYQIRQRIDQMDLWRHLGLPEHEVREAVAQSESSRAFRVGLFSRLVPILRDIGLLSNTVRRALIDLGGVGFEDVDLDAIVLHDEEVAVRLEAARLAGSAPGQGQALTDPTLA